jgi:hypothetical protein
MRLSERISHDFVIFAYEIDVIQGDASQDILTVTRDVQEEIMTDLLVGAMVAGYHAVESPARLPADCDGQSKARV